MLAVEPALDPLAPDVQHAVGSARAGQPQDRALLARSETSDRPGHADARHVLDTVQAQERRPLPELQRPASAAQPSPVHRVVVRADQRRQELDRHVEERQLEAR